MIEIFLEIWRVKKKEIYHLIIYTSHIVNGSFTLNFSFFLKMTILRPEKGKKNSISDDFQTYPRNKFALGVLVIDRHY